MPEMTDTPWKKHLGACSWCRENPGKPCKIGVKRMKESGVGTVESFNARGKQVAVAGGDRRVLPSEGRRKTLEQLAREWAVAKFTDFDDIDVYVECFTAGYRAARPLRAALAKARGEGTAAVAAGAPQRQTEPTVQTTKGETA